MKKLSIFILIIINSVTIGNAQTLEWFVDDSTFNSSSGYVLALPHNEMYVVPGSFKGFSVFKYDENGAAIFRKNFSDSSSYSYVAVNRLSDEEGNLYVAGTIEDSVYNPFYFVSKIDSDGNQLWQLLVPVSETILYFGQMIFDNVGNIYLTATLQDNLDQHSNMLVCKVSDNGNLMWSRQYGDSVNRFSATNIAMAQDGSIIVAGGQESIIPYHGYLEVLKYDPDGNLIWHQEITDDGNGDDTGFPTVDLSIDHAGNIFVCGNARSLDMGLQRDYPYVFKLDGSGNKVWVKEIFDHSIILIGAYGFYLTGTLGEDGSYYAAGYDTLFQIVIVKFSTDGDVLWVKNHLPMYNTSIGSINNLKFFNGYLFAAGVLNDLAHYSDYLIIASDVDGNVQWTARYNSGINDNNYLASLAFDNNGNVLVSGYSSISLTNTHATTTLKYSNFLTGVDDPGKNNFAAQVFPNPATDMITIGKAPSDAPKNSFINISDEYGRNIISALYSNKPGALIDVHDLTPGIYFYQVMEGERKVFDGKFVKQ